MGTHHAPWVDSLPNRRGLKKERSPYRPNHRPWARGGSAPTRFLLNVIRTGSSRPAAEFLIFRKFIAPLLIVPSNTTVAKGGLYYSRVGILRRKRSAREVHIIVYKYLYIGTYKYIVCDYILTLYLFFIIHI